MSSPPKPASPWAVKLVHEGKEQGLPVEKIRQKLVLEGVEPEVINTVVSEAEMGGEGSVVLDEPIAPSSPPTSPQRRQLSAR